MVRAAEQNRAAYRWLTLTRTLTLFDGWFDWWGVNDATREAAAAAARRRVHERLG